jgi:hypothetical protein
MHRRITTKWNILRNIWLNIWWNIRCICHRRYLFRSKIRIIIWLRELFFNTRLFLISCNHITLVISLSMRQISPSHNDFLINK